MEVARKGSYIIIVGVVPDKSPISMDIVQDHELSLLGSAMYRVEDYREASNLTPSLPTGYPFQIMQALTGLLKSKRIRQ